MAVIPKKLRAKPPKPPGNEPWDAFMDVWGEQFDDDLHTMVKIPYFTSDNPREVRQLARYLEKCAAFLERCDWK